MNKFFITSYYMATYGLPDRLNRIMFYPRLKKIINTAPISSRNDGLVILSMVSHKDILMYLLAMKSLDRFLQRGRFEVINDGTLTAKDIEMIKNHICGVQLTDFRSINNTRCPKRGVWERLLHAIELSQNERVLVVDSDVLIQKDVREVKECINRNQNFIIGVGQNVQPMLDIWRAEIAGRDTERIHKYNIQQYFDSHLDAVPESGTLKYLKATNGFNGFAKNFVSRSLVEEWSTKLENVFGWRWRIWGTEQIMACLLVANYGSTVVLQEPKYGLYYAKKGKNYDAMSVIHFIGTHRYRNGYYAKAARGVIGSLINGK